MISFYKEVIKDLQSKLPMEDTLLKALTCLNPKHQKAHDSLQHCKVVASQMPSLQPKEVVIAGDDWIRYQEELELKEDDLKLRVDHFWYKVFSKVDPVGELFAILPKWCALSLCYSNADVERSLSINKRIVIKQKVSMKKETVIGVRIVKAAIQGYGGLDKVTITLDLVKVAEISYRLYNEHLREEQAQKDKRKQKH